MAARTTDKEQQKATMAGLVVLSNQSSTSSKLDCSFGHPIRSEGRQIGRIFQDAAFKLPSEAAHHGWDGGDTGSLLTGNKDMVIRNSG